MGPNVALALQIAYDLLRHAAEIQALLGQAVAQNRDITDAELEALNSAGAIAGSRLDQAIKEAETPSVGMNITNDASINRN